MNSIENAVSVVKRAQAAEARAKREREAINEVAKKQRVERRRLKRALEKAISYIPTSVRDDQFFEESDNLINKDEI